MIAELHSQLDGASSDSSILNWFAAKYGATVLAAPIRGGFDNVAWIVPIAVFFLATVGTGVLIWRWKSQFVRLSTLSPVEIDAGNGGIEGTNSTRDGVLMGTQTAIPHGDRVRGNMRPLFRLGGVLVGPIQKDGPLARLLEWYPHRPLASARVRILITAIVISTLWFTCDVARASRLDDNSPTDLTALRVKADKAKPEDRCFLYAQIVHQLAELAAQQFNSGDSEGVSETLKQVQLFAVKVQVDVGDDSRN
jgi:hypothetical protein